LSKKPANSVSLRGCIDMFTDLCDARNLSPATTKFYKENLDRFVRYLTDKQGFENPVVQDFNVENIKKYLASLKNKQKWEEHATITVSKQKIGSQSIRTYTRALRAFGNWLYKEGLIDEDILDKIELPKAEKKDKEILTDQEIAKVLNTLNPKTELGLRNTAIFLLTVDTGLRQKTIANLKICDIDFEQRTVRVGVKGNRITVLPLGKTAIRRLREYIIKHRHFDLDDDNAYLFISASGEKLTENAIKKMFSKLAKKSGVKRLHCHLGRHTFATNYINDGHNSQELMIALTHLSQKIADEYVHLAERITFARRGADSHIDTWIPA